MIILGGRHHVHTQMQILTECRQDWAPEHMQ